MHLLVRNPLPRYADTGKGMSNVANVYDKIRMLNMFRLNPDRFLPIVDHAWKVFPEEDRGTEWYDDKQVNIGWDTGLLGADRPYFAEGWAMCGITMLTYFVSAAGMEDASKEDLIRLLTGDHLFRLNDPENPRTDVMKFEDDNGNVFFSVNVTVGMEDETYITGGTIYPFEPLNEYNRRKNGEAKKNETE